MQHWRYARRGSVAANDDCLVEMALEVKQVGKYVPDVFVGVDASGGKIVQLIDVGRRALLRRFCGIAIERGQDSDDVLTSRGKDERCKSAAIDHRKFRHVPIGLIRGPAQGIAVENGEEARARRDTV